jgi:hypothetical protein
MIKTVFFYFFIFFLFLASCKKGNELILSCSENNDLYKTLRSNNIVCKRFNTPTEAIKNANEGSGVLILADHYPQALTVIDSILIAEAKEKKIRLFIEYPSYIPGIKVELPHSAELERIVVSTDSINNLEKLQIIEIHDCHYIPVLTKNPFLVVTKVAGFDYAYFGIENNTDIKAILFEPNPDNLLISTTKLSQFIQARYAPQKSIQALWSFILDWVSSGQLSNKQIEWIPTVTPTYDKDEKLDINAEKVAVQRGIDWYFKSKMILNNEGWENYKKLWKLDNTNIRTTVASVNSSAEQPNSDVGDGSFGVLEGIVSDVRFDGSQPTRWWLRSDSNGESSLAFALRWAMDGNQESKIVAHNLLDWVYFKSGLFQNDPQKANYGLLFWAPGNAQALYQDNDVKSILGCIGTSAILQSNRWNDVLVKNILGNFRTTGINGFRGWRLENPDLIKNGWKSYWEKNTIQLQPHYEAWMWASYLWLYNQTQWRPLLDRTQKGIRTMMEAYPDKWRWTNGIQQERGRMLLTLAWLIRVEDRPEYREWLRRLATDMEKSQDASGAIGEELGMLLQGDMTPPSSNENYGKGEAPLIQKNGDTVADLLYTCNFTFLGLHEAYAATSDPQFKRMADKLADFLVRIQIKSEMHNNLDGGWFRAFDYNRWEYWGSNSDSGWGAWAIETGWTQSWIPTVLAMRVLNKNLWDISKVSDVESNFEMIRKQMIPE